MVGKKRLFIIILFVQFSSMAFSDEEKEKRFSIQVSPLLIVSDIVYLFIDNDIFKK